MRLIFLISALFLFLSSSSFAQKPSFDRWFWPNPGLPRNAQSPLFQDSLSLRPFEIFYDQGLFSQINQTKSKLYQIPLDGLIQSDSVWTMELWLLNHTNQSIGFEVFLDEKAILSNWDRKWLINDQWQKQKFYDRYFSHIIIQNRVDSLTVFENGIQIFSTSSQSGQQIFFQSYLQEEPYMKLDHWLKHLVFYSELLSKDQISHRFELHQQWKKEGTRLPGSFHFMAEPYLFSPGLEQMQITFELDRQADVTLRYGESTNLSETLKLESSTGPIYSTNLLDLKISTPYFYQIIATDSLGNELDTGILTFRTSPEESSPIVFGLVSDTEARPQINEQISLQLWDERVDFTIHLGDITDGGQEPEKWQWTQEFFPGSSALYSRIPNVPVAGNGEGDLYWYKNYHPQANNLGCYVMNYGPASFFILNSNRPNELQPGGVQYKWLENELKKSVRPWKFVMMHHAPYSMDENDYGNTWEGNSTFGDRRFQELLRLIEKSAVQMMFFGHLHTYHRTFPIFEDKINFEEGITFVQVGGMGGNLEDFAPNRIPFSAKTFRGFHYGTIALHKDKLEMRIYSIDGKLLDVFDLLKN